MRVKLHVALAAMALAALALASLPAAAEESSPQSPVFSARAGLGTDINLGVAVGGGFGWLKEFAGLPPVDFGIDFYYYDGTEISEEQVGPSLNTYEDKTTLMVFAVSADFLHGYEAGARGFYYLTGLGAAAVSVEWVGYSADDPSYNDSRDYASAGLLVKLGVAYAFGKGLELRLVAPILVFEGPQDSLGFAPMLNLAAALRF